VRSRRRHTTTEDAKRRQRKRVHLSKTVCVMLVIMHRVIQDRQFVRRRALLPRSPPRRRPPQERRRRTGSATLPDSVLVLQSVQCSAGRSKLRRPHSVGQIRRQNPARAFIHDSACSFRLQWMGGGCSLQRHSVYECNSEQRISDEELRNCSKPRPGGQPGTAEDLQLAKL
jgi:hypothetical protein